MLEKSLLELEEKRTEQNKKDIFEATWIKSLLEKKEITELTREIIVEMIDSICVYEGKRIKIVYNFSDEYEELMKTG